MSSRLTRIQVHERFKQNFNALYSRCPQMGTKDDNLDDSLTSLQWLQNLNVNIVNPINSLGIPQISVANTASGGRRVVGCPRNRGGREYRETKHKPKAGDVAHIEGLDSPVKGDPGSQSGKQNYQRLQSRLLAGKEHQSTKSRGSKRNPLPPLIPQSRTPLPNQYRSRGSRESNHNSLPRMSGSNDSLKLNTKLCENATILTVSPEISLFSDSSPQYLLSPRQCDRDLLPGQVDYKNNPYVKPPFSHAALICMALHNNREKKMTVCNICKWIKDNFIYYRYVDPGWQNSIRDNLNDHKCFEKVSRGNSDKGSYWRINPRYEDMFSNGVLRKRRLASAGDDKALSSSSSAKSASRGCSPSITQYSDYDLLTSADFAEEHAKEVSVEELLEEGDFSDAEKQCASNTSSAKGSSAGHKRKQATPHRLTKSKKSKRQQQQHLHNQQQQHQQKVNLLEDQAPELGSLKGDFNWGTILDEIFDGSNAGSSVNSSLSMSLTPTPSVSRKKASGAPVTTTLIRSNEGIFSDIMLSSEMDIARSHESRSIRNGLPTNNSDTRRATLRSPPLQLMMSSSSTDWIKSEKIDVDHIDPSLFVNDKHADGLQQEPRQNGEPLHTPTLTEVELDLCGFLKDVEALDLTVTGKQIEPPENWEPIERILCEKQEENLGIEFPSSSNDQYLTRSPMSSLNTDENSPRGQSKKKKSRRRPGSASSGNDSTNTSPRRITVVTSSTYLPRCGSIPQKNNYNGQVHPWQELKTATDTIESLLGPSFDNVA